MIDKSKIKPLKPTDVAELIAEVYYYTSEDGIRGAGEEPPRYAHYAQLCHVVTVTGQIVIGKALCGSEASYDKEKGKQAAYNDCISQLYPTAYWLEAEKIKEQE